MYFLHAINSDCQKRLLNVFGQTAMFWEIKKGYVHIYICLCLLKDTLSDMNPVAHH
jgi:hypothetical protein